MSVGLYAGYMQLGSCKIQEAERSNISSYPGFLQL